MSPRRPVVTVGFSHARLSNGNRTSSVGVGHAERRSPERCRGTACRPLIPHCRPSRRVGQALPLQTQICCNSTTANLPAASPTLSARDSNGTIRAGYPFAIKGRTHSQKCTDCGYLLWESAASSAELLLCASLHWCAAPRSTDRVAPRAPTTVNVRNTSRKHCE